MATSASRPHAQIARPRPQRVRRLRISRAPSPATTSKNPNACILHGAPWSWVSLYRSATFPNQYSIRCASAQKSETCRRRRTPSTYSLGMPGPKLWVSSLVGGYARVGHYTTTTSSVCLPPAAGKCLSPMPPRVWELRNNLTASDGAYVALAEALGSDLLSIDRRIAGATDIRCRVILVSRKAPSRQSRGIDSATWLNDRGR